MDCARDRMIASLAAQEPIQLNLLGLIRKVRNFGFLEPSWDKVE